MALANKYWPTVPEGVDMNRYCIHYGKDICIKPCPAYCQEIAIGHISDSDWDSIKGDIDFHKQHEEE